MLLELGDIDDAEYLRARSRGDAAAARGARVARAARHGHRRRPGARRAGDRRRRMTAGRRVSTRSSRRSRPGRSSAARAASARRPARQRSPCAARSAASRRSSSRPTLPAHSPTSSALPRWRSVAGGGCADLFACQLDAARRARDFVARWGESLATIIDRGTYLDREDIQGLIDATLPGIDETWRCSRWPTSPIDGEWQRVILDTAPTGHTLRLLALPERFAL